MKESDITTPVIDKCKQLAEHWRMEIYEGCWVSVEHMGSTLELIIGSDKPRADGKDNRDLFSGGNCIPIPTFSDCLDKLRELGCPLEIKPIKVQKWKWRLTWGEPYKIKKPWGGITNCKDISALHEALLSALLEVLKSGVEEASK